MPLILNPELPVYKLLQEECPQVLTDDHGQPSLHLLLLNLMSDKVGAELQYLRCLGTSPLSVRVDFLRQTTYRSANQNEDYLQRFYLSYPQIQDRYYDGLLITGAPLEHISCEDTLYWDEFCRILDWSETHVKTTFCGCWGAFASVYHQFGVAKTNLDCKLSGIYEMDVLQPDEPLLQGMGESIHIPLSRATDMDGKAAKECPELVLLAQAKNGSPVLLKSRDNRFVYVTGHPEYERERLAFEFKRDSEKEKPWRISIPCNYFPQDDASRIPFDHWVEPGKQLFRNWLEYYVAK